MRFGEEVVCIHACGKHCCKRSCALIGLDSRCKDYHIGIDMKLLACDKVGRLNLELAVFGNYLTDHSFDIVYSVFLNGAAVEFVEAFTGCSDVNIEYINVGIRIFFSCQHCVLCGIHTADL